MTLSIRIAMKKVAFLQMLEKRRRNSTPYFPSDDSIINAITPRLSMEDDEHQTEQITGSDYDGWVEQALFDLTRRHIRFQPHPENPALIECPRARLLRLGNEAEQAGTPSEVFRLLMSATDNGKKLPHVTPRALRAAQSSLDIVNDFVNFVVSNKRRYKGYRELKAQFHIADQLAGTNRTPLKINRALNAYGIWSAYAVANARKGKRGKYKGS